MQAQNSFTGLMALAIAMELSQDGIDIIQRLLFDIGQILDFGRGLLDLLVGQFEPQLLHTILDGIPSSQSMCNVHEARNSKVLRIQNLQRKL